MSGDPVSDGEDGSVLDLSDDDGDDGVVATQAPDHRRPSNTGDTVRFVLRGIGQTLITGGLIILLFVVYEVYVTNIFAHQRQVRVHNALEKKWASGQDPLALPGGNQSAIPIGSGIANIYIPRFGRDFAFTVVQGTDDVSLEKGPGHYNDTALPGETGNFAIAGHRVGKGEPFLNLDHLKAGDDVIIETRAKWYVYVVEGDPRTGNLSVRDANNVPGREIVNPSDGQVLLAVPDNPGRTPSSHDRYLTMTTCHPKFTATQRMVLHAQLDPSLTAARSGTTMPSSISALYNKAGV
ncbi:MAG: putative Sortase protein (surface protein transpeptidase) [Pseudonocardiales bacterium]|nr:putative Sortase protein (surface protein transpeptidase) [Pseudonocardiales bacterium]